jgi:hypothetical protein
MDRPRLRSRDRRCLRGHFHLSNILRSSERGGCFEKLGGVKEEREIFIVQTTRVPG